MPCPPPAGATGAPSAPAIRQPGDGDDGAAGLACGDGSGGRGGAGEEGGVFWGEGVGKLSWTKRPMRGKGEGKEALIDATGPSWAAGVDRPPFRSSRSLRVRPGRACTGSMDGGRVEPGTLDFSAATCKHDGPFEDIL